MIEDAAREARRACGVLGEARLRPAAAHIGEYRRFLADIGKGETLRLRERSLTLTQRLVLAMRVRAVIAAAIGRRCVVAEFCKEMMKPVCAQ